MFIGEYSHTIDAKGRMSIPAKFRADLGEIFYLTKGLDKCIFAFPQNEWEGYKEKVRDFPLSKKNARAFERKFLAGAMECSLDKQGRVNVAQSLRSHAGIVKDVVVIGVGSRIEIWCANAWEEYNNNLDYEDIAEQMEELGI